MTDIFSRRELLRRAGLVGAAAIVPADALRTRRATGLADPQTAGRAARPPLESLTAAEARTLDAVAARLIPADAQGIGALEAGATRYIDHALGGALASSREAYRVGLAALEAYARSVRGQAFTDLSASDQDAVLIDLESGAATGFANGSAGFFTLVRAHTIQGTFCDPFYGGNIGFAGWDLIGYPGVRTAVTADEQRFGADLPHTHKSAYDFDMFTKATAAVASPVEPDHGD